MQVAVVPYDAAWKLNYRCIKLDLARSLRMYSATFLAIEHIGSTAVPGLYSQAIIDVMVIVDRIEPATRHDIHYRDVTHYALSQGGYTRIDSGGIAGLLCFRLYPDVAPRRVVYVVENESLICQCFRAMRDTLRKVEHHELKMQYGRLKMELAVREWADMSEYATAKNAVIKDILLRAGWTRKNLKEKDKLPIGGWSDDEEHREYVGFALGGRELKER